MASSAEEWRKAREKGLATRFPSGLEADIRPIELDFFVLHKQIPDLLAPLVNEMIGADNYKVKPPPMEELEKKKEFLLFLQELCRFAFVNPQITDKAEGEPLGPNEIRIEDVPMVDKYFLFLKFGSPASRIKPFPQEQTQPVAVVEPGSNNGNARISDPAR